MHCHNRARCLHLPTFQRCIIAATAIASLSACDRNTIPTGISVPVYAHAAILTPAVVDPLMGDLSPIARHIAAALRDSAVRYELAAAMKSHIGDHVGFDLQDCNKGGVSAHLLHAGEVYGAGAASRLCSTIGAHRGMVLYMAPSRLAVWNPRVSPVVTALAAPDKQIHDRVMAYRSPDRMIDISDPKFVGPILVVLPYANLARVMRASAPPIATVLTFGPTAIPQRGLKGSPPGAISTATPLP